jgi:DNA polymerase-3 subunit alpha
VHSEYSVLDGMSKISALVNKAVKCGMNALALTDHGNMFGIKEFSDYCQKKNSVLNKEIADLEKALKEAEDEISKAEIRAKAEELKSKRFKPIFGCEVYVARKTESNPEGSRFVTENKENLSGNHLVLLAKNLKGYQNLCKIVSAGYINGFYGRPRVDKQLLETYHEGIIVCSACLAGEIHRHIQAGNLLAAREAARWFKNVYGDDYYIELQRHNTDKPGGDKEVFLRQDVQNAELVKISQELGIELVVTNDVHFVEEEHGDAHDMLICLNTGKLVSDEPRMHYTKQEWLKTPDEMTAIFPDFPEALTNTQKIADKVEFYSIDHKPIMPIFDIPETFATEASYRQKYTLEMLQAEFESTGENRGLIEKWGGYDKALRIKLEADYLRELTYKGAIERYGIQLSDELRERIDFELQVIRNMGFPGYFLIVQDFIQAARNMDVSVGPGRGSVAGSVAAYCLKITDIDPLKYGLLFERFLNPDRISLPDIDVDFDDEGRSKVLDYVTQKYGQERVAHIITYGTMATKSSIKDVNRVLGFSVGKGDQLAKLIPTNFPEDKSGKAPKVNIPNCCNLVPELKNILVKDTEAQKVFKYAEQLEGTLRQTGIHACGVIIGADDITKFAPMAAIEDKSKEKGDRSDKKKDKVLVTQYEGSVVETVGLIKMDFLGLRTLTIIKDTLKNIKQTKGIDIDIDSIPINDPLTYQLYSDANTVAIFQFESPGMQKYLKELKPTVFEDLIAMNALYRPGPMQYIPRFIARKHGRESISYDFPIMENHLKETYGITVYQEQVMLLSRKIAGFTRGQSDELRKAMGKKDADKMAALKVKFMDGATQNGFKPKEKVEKIWKDWAEFAKYAFNKSHATCYSLISYQTAYLKAHYPAEFLAANLTNNLGSIDHITMLTEDAKKLGIEVLGPDINESGINFAVTKDGHIRFGLGALKGVGESAASEIIREREMNGAFRDIFNFVERINLRSCNKKNIESLAYGGAFDCFTNVDRSQYFALDNENRSYIEKLISFGSKAQQNKNSNQFSIFDDAPEEERPATPEVPQCEPWSIVQRLGFEREVAGFYISGHPLDPYKLVIDNYTTTTIAELNKKENYYKLMNKNLWFAAMVTSGQSLLTKTGKEYGRIVLDDYTGSYNWTIFSEPFLKHKHLFESGKQLFIKAVVEERTFRQPGELELRLKEAFLLEEACEKLCREVELTLNVNSIDTHIAHQLKEAIDNAKGKKVLKIAIISHDQKFKLDFCSYKQTIDPEKFAKQLRLGASYRLKLR